jgi:hypothetical protein
MTEEVIEAIAERLAEKIKDDLPSLAGTDLAGELEIILRPYLLRWLVAPSRN